MKITKKSFVEAMTTNQITFIGVVKRLLTNDEVYCAIQDMLKSDVILEKRVYKAHSNSLESNNGSFLRFDQQGKYEFFEYTYPECKVYICSQKSYDAWDDVTINTCMYYLVTND